MTNGEIANADYALVMHDGEWIKIYDAGTSNGAILWKGLKFFGGYYSRFNHSRIPSSSSATIKLKRPFKELKNGINFVFKPEDNPGISTISCYYDSNNNDFDFSAHIMQTQHDYFFDKKDLINNNRQTLDIGMFVALVFDNKYCNELYVTTNGYDTIYISDENGQPTSFIGNYRGNDYYLIFDEIIAV